MTPQDLLVQAVKILHKLPKIGGIYIIYCKANDKCYIGSSKWLYMRLAGHRAALNKGRHANPYLQAAYDKYGAEAFSFLAIEQFADLSPEEIVIRENHYIMRLPRESLFNLVVPAVLGSPPVRRTEEHMEAIRNAMRGNQWAKGLHVSEELRAEISLRFKGKKQSSEQIAKRVQSRQETMALNPDALRGESNGRAKLSCDDVREIRRLYAVGNSTQDALAQKFGVSQFVVSQIIRRKTWTHVE